MSKRKREHNIQEESEDDNVFVNIPTVSGPLKHVNQIFTAVQFDESNELKYLKELRKIYDKNDHEDFMKLFLKGIQSATVIEKKNDNVKQLLQFFSKFAGKCSVNGVHTVLNSTLKWILSNNSFNPNIRYRLCELVNLMLNALGNSASLDDDICDKILDYMMVRLKDTNPNVRVQAIMALQRLQMPENPDDDVIKCYLFHLECDPSPRVRQTIITVIGRNYNTIPYIIERLSDIDEKVRRHAYLHMSSYPVKQYKVSQRITFLEKGLNDRSEMVRKVIVYRRVIGEYSYLHRKPIANTSIHRLHDDIAVTTVLLPQWFESYNKNFEEFISAFELDANEAEIDRFRKIVKVALKEMFKKSSTEDLINNLQLQTEGSFKNCLLFSKLSVITTLYWLSLVEYFVESDKDDIDLILPELSVFCFYLLKFCQTAGLDSLDKWERLKNRYILLTLMEILNKYDLGDEVGRANLEDLFELLLKSYELEERVIKVIVECCENLITNQEERSEFFINIIYNTIHIKSRFHYSSLDRIFIENLLEKIQDDTLKLRYSNILVKILDLEEQEAKIVEKKKFSQLEKITEELNQARQDYNDILKSICEKDLTLSTMQNSEKSAISNTNDDSSNANTSEANLNRINILSENTVDLLNFSVLMAEGKRFSEILSSNVTLSSLQVKKITPEVILKCLQIAYYMVRSSSLLTSNARALYKDFICRYFESSSKAVRQWALKCGSAYSMICEPIAEEFYNELRLQLIQTYDENICKTVIESLFEMIDRYGFEKFNIKVKPNTRKTKQGRQLFSAPDIAEFEEETSSSAGNIANNTDLIFMFSHFLDTCETQSVISVIVKGFCRLILHSHLKNEDILQKLIIIYFNPNTDKEVNQILSVFFNNIIKYKMQDQLELCLLPLIRTITNPSFDKMKISDIIKFIIELTKPEHCKSRINIHNLFAKTVLTEMQNNISDKEALRILSKELIKFEITENADDLRKELKMLCEKILERDVNPPTIRNLKDFINLLKGNHISDEKSQHSDKNNEESSKTTIDKTEEETSVNKSTINTERQIEEVTNISEDIRIHADIVNTQSNDNKNITNIPTTTSETIENSIENKNNDDDDEENGKESTTNEQQSNAIANLPKVNILQVQVLKQPYIIPNLTSDSNDDEQDSQELIEKRRVLETVITIPTTYGKENTTNMRYLRKSLNVKSHKNNSVTTEDESPPPKIRIQAKFESGKKNKNTFNQQAISSSPGGDKSKRNNSNNRQHKNSSDLLKRTERITRSQSLRNSDKVSPKTKQNKNDSNESNEEIPPTPQKTSKIKILRSSRTVNTQQTNSCQQSSTSASDGHQKEIQKGKILLPRMCTRSSSGVHKSQQQQQRLTRRSESVGNKSKNKNILEIAPNKQESTLASTRKNTPISKVNNKKSSLDKIPSSKTKAPTTPTSSGSVRRSTRKTT